MRSILFLAALIIILLFFTGCDSRNVGPQGLHITLTSDRDTLHVGDEVDLIILTAQVISDDTGGIAGEQVVFQTNFGKVTSSGITNENGYAFSTFWYDGFVTGKAVIRASFNGVVAEHEVYVVDPSPYLLTVSASPDTIIIGSGVTSSIINAHLTDREGIPLVGEAIGFEAEVGFISPQDITDENGYASANYISEGNEEMEIEIRAKYGNSSAITFIYLEEMDIVYLDIWADSDTVYAGTNNYLTEIYAHLYYPNGNPVTDAYINFTATTGDILSYGITDNMGITHTTFHYDERDMISTIIASYDGITDEIEITIKPFDFGIDSVSANPLEIYIDNDPDTFSTITVRVMNNGGYPVIDEVVHFVTSLGILSEIYVSTDNQGYAVTHLDDTGIPGTAHVDIECGVDDSFIDIRIRYPE